MHNDLGVFYTLLWAKLKLKATYHNCIVIYANISFKAKWQIAMHVFINKVVFSSYIGVCEYVNIFICNARYMIKEVFPPTLVYANI